MMNRIREVAVKRDQLILAEREKEAAQGRGRRRAGGAAGGGVDRTRRQDNGKAAFWRPFRFRRGMHISARRNREAAMSTVLVTGGSGFIGSHCIVQLLAAGHTGAHDGAQSQARDRSARHAQAGGADAGGRVIFCAADLENDAGWREAVAGCEYVLHVASPFPARRAQARGRTDRAGPRRRAAGAARRARRRRQARGADFVVRRHRLRPSAAADAVRRDGLDRSSTAPMSAPIRNRRPLPSAPLGISSPAKAARLNYPWSIRWRVRPGARSGSFDLDRSGAALDGRRAARAAAAAFRCRRRARRCRPAHPRHDASGRQGRALPRRRRRFHVGL